VHLPGRDPDGRAAQQLDFQVTQANTGYPRSNDRASELSQQISGVLANPSQLSTLLPMMEADFLFHVQVLVSNLPQMAPQLLSVGLGLAIANLGWAAGLAGLAGLAQPETREPSVAD
jgi:hypothetical protein